MISIPDFLKLRGSLSMFAASAGLLALAAAAHGQSPIVFLIDLNENNGSGGPGGVWNTYNLPTSITGATMLDSLGAATGITLSRVGVGTPNFQMTDNGNFGLPVFDPAQAGVVNLPDWAAAGGNNQAAGDNFFTGNSAAGQQFFTLSFGGLTVGDKVSLDLLAARNNTTAALGFFEFSLDGGISWSGFQVLNGDGTAALTDGWDTNDTQSLAFNLGTQGFQQHRYLNVADVTLTGTTFDVRTTDGNASVGTFSAINAMRMTVVPEPSAGLMLLMAGASALGLRRRRGIRAV